jgi:hypothetical protein
MAKYPVIIGRAEHIDLVDMALGVPTKIDTGAFRSSIHATKVKVQTKNGEKVLVCELLGHPCSPVVRKFETTEFQQVTVTNSFGQEETRYEVSIKVKLGPKKFMTSFTLADRSNNLFPILAGRKLLKGRYFVDVSSTTVDRIKLKKEFGITAPIDAEDLED